MADERQNRRYEESEARAILDRALERDDPRGLDHDDLLAAAGEVGLSKVAVEASARDVAATAREQGARAAIVQRRRARLRRHLMAYAVVNLVLALINWRVGEPWWFYWPMIGWGLALLVHGRFAWTSEVGPVAIDRELERADAHARHIRRLRERDATRSEQRARLDGSGGRS